MTTDRSSSRSASVAQETAQALVARGEIASAVTLLDRYLSQFDGDWGMWLYFGGLCARSGRRDQAVAAYRASARQLEGDGHLARARDALMSAVRLVPRDEALKRELDRVGRLSRRPPPEVKAGPRVQDPQQTCLLLPVVDPRKTVNARPAPRLPDPAAHITAVIPGRKPKPLRSAPASFSSPEVTDPHCAIFDILDAERAGKRVVMSRLRASDQH